MNHAQKDVGKAIGGWEMDPFLYYRWNQNMQAGLRVWRRPSSDRFLFSGSGAINGRSCTFFSCVCGVWCEAALVPLSRPLPVPPLPVFPPSLSLLSLSPALCSPLSDLAQAFARSSFTLSEIYYHYYYYYYYYYYCPPTIEDVSYPYILTARSSTTNNSPAFIEQH